MVSVDEDLDSQVLLSELSEVILHIFLAVTTLVGHSTLTAFGPAPTNTLCNYMAFVKNYHGYEKML